MPIRMHDLYIELNDAGCVKFGEFKLESGLLSPVYVDLRRLVSKPQLLRRIGEAMRDRVATMNCHGIAGIPYAGIPIAVATSIASGKPMIYPRKEIKEHGTKQAIEGIYAVGERYVVIDDLITDGGSKIEAIKPLEEAGLEVKDVLVILDREQGGEKILADQGYRLHSLGKLSDVLHCLVSAGKIMSETETKVNDWIAANQLA